MHLVPQLLNCLTAQSEDVDDETWNPAMAAGTSLSLLSQAAGDPIVPIVLPFIQQQHHLCGLAPRRRRPPSRSAAYWTDRRPASISALVKQAFPVLLTNMRDSPRPGQGHGRVDRRPHLQPASRDHATLPRAT